MSQNEAIAPGLLVVTFRAIKRNESLLFDYRHVDECENVNKQLVLLENDIGRNAYLNNKTIIQVACETEIMCR